MFNPEYTFDMVDPAPANLKNAYSLHCELAKDNNHILPRNEEKYKELAECGQMFCCKSINGLVGLVYFNLEDKNWEIGGLMVSKYHQGNGIGSILMKLALGHLLFEENPLEQDEGIIAHVHSENQGPRKIIEHSLAFHHSKTVVVPGHQLLGLKTDADGNVHGDKFRITIPHSLSKLSDWCMDWSGRMSNGKKAKIELRSEITLPIWSEAFRDMANRYH